MLKKFAVTAIMLGLVSVALHAAKPGIEASADKISGNGLQRSSAAVKIMAPPSDRPGPKVDGDLALWSMDVPYNVYIAPNVAFTPTVTVNNTGSTIPLTGYQVVFLIDGGATYADTVFVNSPDSIQPGANIQYTFDNFTPAASSGYMCTAFVTLAGDPNTFNDTLEGAFVTFNMLEGNVADDNNSGAPLEGVAISAAGPASYATTTDSSGNYSFLVMNAGYYTVTATLSGYVTEIIDSLLVVDGLQTTQDIGMGYPVLSYGPADSMYASLVWGASDSTTWDLTLSNTGTRDLHYSLRWPADTAVNDTVPMVLDDGSMDNSIGIGGTAAFMFLNRFTPDPAAFPFLLTEVQSYFSTDGMVNIGDSINIVIYENTSGNTDPAVGSNVLYSYLTTVQVLDAFSVYSLPEPVQLNGPGDVLIGVIGLEIPGTSYWPASLDQTATQARSWAGWWSTVTPPSDKPALPPDDTWVLIDTYFPGNWMIRGYGEIPAENATWLTLAENSGTIGASNSHNLGLTFNSAGCDSFTSWGANINIISDGQLASKYNYTVPAYMHVLGTTMGVEADPQDKPKAYAFALNANHPNPSRVQTTFSFTLPQAQDYSLRVYNIAGQVVHSAGGAGKAGLNNVVWNTGKTGGGVYFYTLTSGGQRATRKLVVVR